MTTTIRLALCILVASAPAWLAARAADSAHATGHVLLLDNEGTLEGDIERVGDQYRVRRPHGETWVPGDKVLGLCANLEDAYAFLRRRANLDDADERLRLARWCHLHGLRGQALAEVTAAVQLRPDQPEGRRLLASLQQAAGAPAPSRAARAEAEPGPAAPPDLAAESLCGFRTRVQPILMNACAGCHATGRGGSFKLLRVYDEGANRQTVQRNLAAVLAQVNLRSPQGSPLLTKAVSAHDGRMAQAPLRGREAPAYRALEEWVRQTLTENPQLQEVSPAPETTDGQGHERPAAAAPAPPAAPPRAPAAPAATATAQTVAATPPPKFVPAERPPEPPKAAAPAAPDAPADPFDPGVFNRQMHPGRPTPEAQ
jgi:hypothetical protein